MCGTCGCKSAESGKKNCGCGQDPCKTFGAETFDSPLQQFFIEQEITWKTPEDIRQTIVDFGLEGNAEADLILNDDKALNEFADALMKAGRTETKAVPIMWEDYYGDDDGDNNGKIYGISYTDGYEVLDMEWFTTAKERDAEIAKYNKEFGAEKCECKNYTPNFNQERPMTTDDEEEQAVIVPITCDDCGKKGQTVYLYGYNEYDNSNLKWFDAETFEARTKRKSITDPFVEFDEVTFMPKTDTDELREDMAHSKMVSVPDGKHLGRGRYDRHKRKRKGHKRQNNPKKTDYDNTSLGHDFYKKMQHGKEDMRRLDFNAESYSDEVKAKVFDKIFEWHEQMQLQGEGIEYELDRMRWMLENPDKGYDDYPYTYDGQLREGFDAEMVHCGFCSDIIGTEEEVYEEETIEYEVANGETICVSCGEQREEEYKNDLDPHYSPFYAENFEAYSSLKGHYRRKKAPKSPASEILTFSAVSGIALGLIYFWKGKQ